MGSFSFVNAQAFENLLRQIGQQALGYAFQLAINSMCHSCGALLSSIQSAMQKMNSSLKNTCQLAHGLASRSLGDSLTSINQSVGQVMSSATGVASDIFQAFDNTQSAPGTNQTALASKTATVTGDNGQQQTVPAAALLPQGNMTWKALENSQSDQLIDQDNNLREKTPSGRDSEEFQCARLIDAHRQVKYWVRNIERQPRCSFWFPTATDYFYPDFVAELQDGRVLIVEYKGEPYETNDDSREKRQAGDQWERSSGGRCLFPGVRQFESKIG